MGFLGSVLAVRQLTDPTAKSWEHKRLADLADALGAAHHVDKYPSDAFDLIWTDEHPYKKITSVASENCPGLDP